MSKLRMARSKSAVAIFGAFALLLIGGAFAISNDSSLFQNPFGVATYETTATETFTSPTNWMTCETVDKTITVTNNSSVPIAARISLTENWKDADGNALFLTFTDENDNTQNWAIININTDDWTKDGYYYYYKEDLAPGATSSTFMTGVTLNCDANLVGSTHNNATYTLSATVQTIAADSKSAWSTAATLMRGGDVNTKLKTIAGTALYGDDPTWTEDYNIKSIRRASSLPANFDTTDPAHIISADGSEPIYAWFDNTDDAGIIYLFSNSHTIKAGSNISHVCDHMRALVDAPALSEWDMSSATDLTAMFQGTYALETLDISGWDVSNVRDMKGLFFEAKSLTSLDISSWDTSNVVNMMAMFYGMESLVSLNLSGWNTSNVSNMSFLFHSTHSLASLGLAGWDTSSATDMKAIFYEAQSLTALNLSGWNVSNITDMSYMFYQAKSLTTLNVSGWDTSKVTDMSAMFSVGDSYLGNGKLEEIIGLENFDTSSVTDMTAMFYGAGQMTAYNISGWNVSNVQSLQHMFCDNFKLKSLDLSRWNTISLKTAYDMFDDAKALTTIGDISHWNTTNLIDVGGFLNGATSFVGDNGTFDLSGWDTSGLMAAGEMFRATRLTTVDLTGWTFDSATNATWPGAGSGIYYETGNTSSYKGLSGMFLNMPNLQNVYLTQDGKDSFDAAVERGVNVTKFWEGSPISDFTIVPNP